MKSRAAELYRYVGDKMRYAITKFQIAILDWIARKIVVQSHRHETNIIEYYKVLSRAARDEFREDNKYTLDSFLEDCFKKSIEHT